jgi:hypothetical protein
MIWCPIINTRRMSSTANKFKMDRHMNRQYRHRFIRRLRVWLQFRSRVSTEASDDPTPWQSVHPTVAFKFNRDTPRLLLQHRMNRRLIEDTIGSSDTLIQIIQYRPKCGAFDTGWSDGASVYSVGVLSGFQGSTAILASISDRMIRRSAGGHHRFIDCITFSGDFFQRLALFARPINKPPASLELPLPLWRSIAA